MAEQKVSTRTAKSARRRVPLATRIGRAEEVVVTGDFTGWSEDGIRLSQGADGAWSTTLKLAPGEYQYRLRVDGVWQDHAEAERRVPNPYGTENCVLTVE
jgi:1,4-alpha-glucan branching enzyme